MTEVVDGAGGSVVVVVEAVDVVVEVGAELDDTAAGLAGEPESEHAAPKAIDVVTNAMTAHFRLVSGRSHA